MRILAITLSLWVLFFMMMDRYCRVADDDVLNNEFNEEFILVVYIIYTTKTESNLFDLFWDLLGLKWKLVISYW